MPKGLRIDMYNSRLKNVTGRDLKGTYQNLIEGRMHSAHCTCVSCLYHFLKRRHKKARLGRDEFFLYYLAFFYSTEKEGSLAKIFSTVGDRRRDWKKIKNVFFNIVGPRESFEYPETDHYRIISRHDKKANIPKLINTKKAFADMLPFKVSPFLCEAQRILESIRIVTGFGVDWLRFLERLDVEGVMIFLEFISRSFKVIDYLMKLKNKSADYRQIYRKHHLSREDLLIILDYLERKKILTLDKENKKAALGPEWFEALKHFSSWLELIKDGLKTIQPFSIQATRNVFIQQLSQSTVRQLPRV